MRTLLLDIGGVFYVGRPDEAFWARWATRTGVAQDTLAQGLWHGPDIARANVGDLSAAEYFARTAARLHIPAATVGNIITDAFRVELNHELIAFVRTIRARGVSVSALTNSWTPAPELKKRHEFVGIFDIVVSSTDTRCAKPDAAIYHIALRRLGVPAHDVIFVDDTPENVETARRLGLQSIHFQDTAVAIAQMEQLLR